MIPDLPHPWPLTMFVHGHPRAYGSKVPVIDWVKRKWFMRESSKLVEPWKKEVRSAMKAQLAGPWAPHVDVHLPLIDQGQAVGVAFRFFIPLPKSVRGLEPYPVRKAGNYAGDWDKMARAVGDCGSDTGLWWDDCQIIDGLVQQRWASDTQPAGVLIAFWPVIEEG